MAAKLILIGSDSLGAPEPDLGRLLMGNFLRNLGDRADLPNCIVLWNGGVLLAAADSPVLDHLKRLDERGVAIVSCRTCIEYFELESKVGVGQVDGMVGILERLSTHEVLTV